MSNALVTIHNELYHAPEEFATSPGKEDREESVKLPDSDEPFLRAASPAKPPQVLEPPTIPDSVPLHLALPFNGDLPELPHLPQLLYDGQLIHPSNVSTMARQYANKFREEVGGCKIPKGKHRKVVAGEAGDLFCFGDEDHSDWEEDNTRDAELFDAPVDDAVKKIIGDAE
jgi:hypothetical protein